MSPRDCFTVKQSPSNLFVYVSHSIETLGTVGTHRGEVACHRGEKMIKEMEAALC